MKQVLIVAILALLLSINFQVQAVESPCGREVFIPCQGESQSPFCRLLKQDSTETKESIEKFLQAIEKLDDNVQDSLICARLGGTKTLQLSDNISDFIGGRVLYMLLFHWLGDYDPWGYALYNRHPFRLRVSIEVSDNQEFLSFRRKMNELDNLVSDLVEGFQITLRGQASITASRGNDPGSAQKAADIKLKFTDVVFNVFVCSFKTRGQSYIAHSLADCHKVAEKAITHQYKNYMNIGLKP